MNEIILWPNICLIPDKTYKTGKPDITRLFWVKTQQLNISRTGGKKKLRDQKMTRTDMERNF